MFEPALLQQLVQRELAKDKLRSSFETSAPEKPIGVSPLPPKVASILGGVMDAAGTYYMLKTGKQTEDNKLLSGLNNHPEGVGAVAGLSTLALQPLFDLLAKRWPGVSKAVQSNLGALQLGYGTANFGNDRRAARDVYSEAVTSNINKGIK